MTDLKQLYRQAVVGRMAELEGALREAQTNAAGSEDTLRRIAHSLRGSGSTYGFPEVTDAAGLVEDAHSGELQPKARALITVLKRVIEGGPKPKRILVVDDDPEILLLLHTVLAASGRELVSAEDGTSAIAQLDGRPFALIILDLLLPDFDGRDVLKRIRSEPRYEKTPVVVLSAKTTQDTRRECAELGATAFFEKPFDPEAVAAAVGAQIIRASDSEAENSE